MRDTHVSEKNIAEIKEGIGAVKMTPVGSESPSGDVASPVGTVQNLITETLERDAIIDWFRGEFAAANAIIDALCCHLVQLQSDGVGGGRTAYEAVFAAIHRRRFNWIPIIQMQKYHSIADVAIELTKVFAKKESSEGNGNVKISMDKNDEVEDKKIDGKVTLCEGNDISEPVEQDDSPDSEVTDGGGSQGAPTTLENIQICSNHEECDTRVSCIKMTKSFVAKEPLKGHMVNIVRGLKLYENIFSVSELSKLTDFVNELRFAGQNGQLPGETFKIINKKMKGNKRELIQFGVPIFRQIKQETQSKQETNYIEPIPPLLQNVIDHLVQWRLLPNLIKMPNSCIINFFDEGEYSQPYLKPPHVEQPLSTLLLSESKMAFGCTLVSDSEGNYKAPQMLSLKKGSLLVMRGNSTDLAAHVMCPSPTKRASITFFNVRSETNQNNSPVAMASSPPIVTTPFTMQQNNAFNSGLCHASPMVMIAPPVYSMDGAYQGGGGTGVFLPWNSQRSPKHLPLRVPK